MKEASRDWLDILIGRVINSELGIARLKTLNASVKPEMQMAINDLDGRPADALRTLLNDTSA